MKSQAEVPIRVEEESWFSSGTDSPELLLKQIRGLIRYWKKKQDEFGDQPQRLAKAKRMERRCRRLLREMKLEIAAQQNGEAVPLPQTWAGE